MRRLPIVASIALLAVAGPALAFDIGRTDSHPLDVAAAAHATAAPRSSTNTAARATGDSEPVPILMYHVIGDPLAAAAFPELFVRPVDFAGQMRWLSGHGYHAVTLGQVWAHWHGSRGLPRRPIVLTFDDGYRSDVGVALPVLRKHGWAGVLNLKVGNLKPGDLLPRGVRRLIAAGWEIDAHTITHPDLTMVDDRRLEYEVSGSRKALRRMFRVPVDFFCYPAGRYDARVIQAVRRAGFLGATTTNYGLAKPSEPYTLARVRVAGSDGVAGFAAKLTALRG